MNSGEFETIDDHLEKIVAIIKRDVVKDVMSQDVRVLNQKTIWYKLWCGFNYRHLFDQWRNIVYSYIESFKEYILETGEKAKLPLGLGEFSINKKIRKKIKVNHDREFINLPIDWQKTKAKGKVIYNFNFHTEGYYFGWMWFKKSARFKHSDLWYFRPSRITSRLLCHYIKSDTKYQHLYMEWITKKHTAKSLL